MDYIVKVKNYKGKISTLKFKSGYAGFIEWSKHCNPSTKNLSHNYESSIPNDYDTLNL